MAKGEFHREEYLQLADVTEHTRLHGRARARLDVPLINEGRTAHVCRPSAFEIHHIQSTFLTQGRKPAHSLLNTDFERCYWQSIHHFSNRHIAH